MGNPGGNFNAPTYEYCAMGTKCSACPSTHQQGCVDDSGTSGSGAAFGLCSNGGVLASPPPPPADPEPQSGSSNCPMGSDEVGQQVSFCATYKAYCSQYGDAMTVDWSDGKKYGLTQICPDTCACEAAPPSWGGSSNCGECAAHSEYGANNPKPTYPEPSYATTVTLSAASGGVTSDDDTSNDRLTTSEVIGLPSVRASSVLQWLELRGQFRLHGPRPQWEPFKSRLESAAPTILLLRPMPSRWNHSHLPPRKQSRLGMLKCKRRMLECKRRRASLVQILI